MIQLGRRFFIGGSRCVYHFRAAEWLSLGVMDWLRGLHRVE